MSYGFSTAIVNHISYSTVGYHSHEFYSAWTAVFVVTQPLFYFGKSNILLDTSNFDGALFTLFRVRNHNDEPTFHASYSITLISQIFDFDFRSSPSSTGGFGVSRARFDADSVSSS